MDSLSVRRDWVGLSQCLVGETYEDFAVFLFDGVSLKARCFGVGETFSSI